MHKCLGEILLEMGYVTEGQIEEAMGIWRQPGEERRIGEILVDMRVITAAQVNEALDAQRSGAPTRRPKKRRLLSRV
jgi:hypothetical protein